MTLFLLLAACNEYGFTDAKWTDTFQQDRANEVDLLIVIDNSCSMVEEQDNLARNFDALLSRFVEADVDWRVGVTTTDIEDDRYRGRLQGGDDEVVLRGPMGELDRVAWDRTWGFQDGVSLQLSGDLRFTSDNDRRSAWCPSTASYGSDGELGTPGHPNPDCLSGITRVVTFNAPDEGPRPPLARDVTITELHPQSAGDDRRCEWIELTSNTPDTLQLEGLELFDRGRNHVVLPAYEVPPGGVVVIGRALEDTCGAPVDIAFSEGFTLNDDLRYIDASREDAAELFAEAVSPGTTGSGIEAGLEAARLTMIEPWFTDDNASWMRPDARLALLFVSDEDDFSPLSVDGYLNAFMQMKGTPGYRDPHRVTVSSVVGTQTPPQVGAPACISDDGIGFFGERYLAAANRTGGLAASICEEDFAPIVSQLGLTLSGVSLEFFLSRVPVLESLEVELYASADADSLLGPLELDEDFTYDAERNALVFTTEQAPASSTWLSVRYNEVVGAVP